MSKKNYYYVIFFIILFLGFYISIFYKNSSLEQKKYITINSIKPFKFLNQYNDTITENTIKNKVIVVNYFFTSCQGICPKMNKVMNEIYKQFGDNKNFIILSHTVEPENDSVKILLKYSEQFNIKNKNWHFLVGNKVELYTQARLSYSLDDPKNNVGDIKDQFIHTQFFALVNMQGNVVGIYDSLIKSEIEKLKEDISKCLIET